MQKAGQGRSSCGPRGPRAADPRRTGETLMPKKMLVGSVIGLAALAGSAGTGHSGVSVDLGIHLGAPAPLEPVPASPVYYAPTAGANLFSLDGAVALVFATRGRS